MGYIEESKVIRNEYGTPREQQKIRMPYNEDNTSTYVDFTHPGNAVDSMRVDRNNTPAMKAYKQQEANNKAIVENMKINKERMLREGYTPDQLENTVDTIKKAKRFVKSVESKHESVIDIVKGLKNKSLGQAERMKYAEMLSNAEKRGLIKVTKTPEGENAIIDINGKLTKLDDLEDGMLASMGYLLLDSPAALATGIVGAIPVAKAIGTAAKAAAVSKPGQYMLQLAGFSGASSVGTMIDDKLLQAKRDRYLKNPVFKDLMESQPNQNNFEDSFSAVVTFDRKKAQVDFNKLNHHISNLGSIQSMIDAGGKDIINSMALSPVIDGILGGSKYVVKSAAPYATAGAKWVAKQAPSTAAGATTGSLLTAGLSAVGVPLPVAVGAGAVTGAVTRNKIKAGQDFVASSTNKVITMGKQHLKDKNINEVFNNAREQVGSALKKKNADPAYSVEGYLKQYYGEMFNNPSVLPTLVNKLGSFGIKLDINNNTDKALAVMLMSPNAPQFIKVMVNDNPAAGVAIRDMLAAFSVAFDNQIKNMLPINNKQMSVATFASDLKTMQTNNIAALNELAKYGNKLTNNKVVSGVSANEYRDVIRNYADGKQLVNSGLPSKLSNRKKNIAAHKEDNQNLFTRFATLNDTEAKAVSEKGLLKGANFEDLVTMRANLAVIDDETILAAPSIANLRIAIDQGLEEVLSAVSDSVSRDALRNQMQQVVNKIHAFEKLGNNKLLGAIMRENNPDAILKHFANMMQEIQILDNASAIKQVMSILPIQKQAQLETLIINKIIEDVTDNLDTPGKLVINSAKLRSFIGKVEGQFSTSEGKALLSILKDYAEVFGDSAALMKAATTKSTKTGPAGGIGHNLFNKFRVYMAGKLFRNLIGYLGPGHSSSTFRLANILAKRLRDPLDPNIGKAVDNLYNARLQAYKNAKTPEAAAAAKADIEAIKEANNLAGEVNAMQQKINANVSAIQDMEISLRQQGINGKQVENIISEQLGIPTKTVIETPAMQVVPISDMKNLVNINVNKLLQIEPELVKAMESDLYKRITSEAIEIAENFVVNNKQFNIRDFINTIIYRYNQVLPNNMNKYSLQEITEQDLKSIIDNTVAAREEARKAYEIEKAAAYEAEQAEQMAKQEAEAIANQEKEAAEEIARQQRAQAEAEAATKREAENTEAKKAAEIEKEKKTELAKEKAKEKRNAKKQAAKEMEEKLARMEEKAANEAEKQVARDAEIEKLQEEGVRLAEQVTKATNDKIAKGETEAIFNQNLGVKFGFIKDGRTFKQSISTDKMLSWKERDKLTMLANDEYFAKNLDIKSVAENAKKILADTKIPGDEKANVRQLIRDLESILPLNKFTQLNELITGKSVREKNLVINPIPTDYQQIKHLIKFPYGEKQIDKLNTAVKIDKAIMSAKKQGKTYYRDWVNKVIYHISPSWRLDTELFFNKALGTSSGADNINKFFGMKVISDEIKNKVEYRLKNGNAKDPFIGPEFSKLYYDATGIEQVYIQRNIPRIIINDAKAAGINFNKFVKDKNGNPVIIYRGVNNGEDETGFPINLLPEELYDRAINLDKPYKFTGEDPSKFLGPNEESPRYIMRNAIYTSRSINHSLHFARNDLNGLGHFFLRADAKVLNKSMSGERFGTGNKYVKELYNEKYASAIYTNQEGESIRKELVNSDAVALSDDTLVVFNEKILVHPIEIDNTTKLEPLKPVVFYNHGAAVGAIAGIEQNEDGSFSFNIERALLGMALGYGIHQTAPKLQTVANNLMQNDKFMNLVNTMLHLPNGRNTPSPALMKANVTPTKIMRDELNRVNIAFMVGGENAAREPSKLQKAKNLKARGADDLSIYRETGWRYNSAQDKWKFDFDAKAAWIDETHVLNLFNKFKKAIDGIASIPLGELIPKAKTLFKYYPNIKNTLAIIGEKDNPILNAELDGASATYRRMEASADNLGRIYIPIEELKNNKTTLQHEVQHNIQELERYIGLEDYKTPGFADIISYINKGNFYNDVPMRLHELLPNNVIDYLSTAKVEDKDKWLAKLKIIPTTTVKVYGINTNIIGINPNIIKTDRALQQVLIAAALYKNIPLDKIEYYMKLIEQEARYVEYATNSARLGLKPVPPIDLNSNANKLMEETRVIR